ncbi:cupin domain-containing protein [Thermococcus piezophilus]|uniref:Cupin n=1 Tax=Thermococcus piezophilus TaxID=1712654 RepID=A0A172WIF1_9EURY|nr:cupin domain-containing protein [Thermococcus piezophilus]ANF23190.1 cupin [Thermococcus piezophilus]
MIVVNVENAEGVENPHGVDVRKLLAMEKVSVLHVSLKPGEELKKHSTSVDAFLYVLKGRGVVEVGEERAEVKKGYLVYLPKNIPHSVSNAGSMEMSFLVVKVV